MSSWLRAIDAVALALADEGLGTGQGEPAAQSMLADLTGLPSAHLRQRLHRSRAAHADNQTEPLIHRNEIPLYLLSHHIVDIAAAAVAELPAHARAGLPADDRLGHQVTGLVAAAALSTLRFETHRPGEIASLVRRRLPAFGVPEWTAALDRLAARMAELHGFLIADPVRRRTWHDISIEDRILAEALAGAVVGGAADESGVPPAEWQFPFHLFCNLALSAAQDALATIEAWLGTEFAPPPRSAERAADLAVLVESEARVLHHGCGCKDCASSSPAAFKRRGACRQEDHDLRTWLPGMPKPGGNGGLYASTLWGWLRRWLGGAAVGRAGGEGRSAGRPRLRPNDVAGSVLARCWLNIRRDDDSPVLLYDRIVPEFCDNCQSKTEISTTASASGLSRVERARCCDHPRRVYRSEYGKRNGRSVIRPKLGVIVASLNGGAGYQSTESLGPLWLCAESGRYSLSPDYCPGCGVAAGSGRHEMVQHGWVLLPLAEAWNELLRTKRPELEPDQSEDLEISQEDLLALERAFRAMGAEYACAVRSAADAWEVARGWTKDEINKFRVVAGRDGLHLLWRCKRVAEGKPPEDTGESRA